MSVGDKLNVPGMFANDDGIFGNCPEDIVEFLELINPAIHFRC